jgi:hypothetical protein
MVMVAMTPTNEEAQQRRQQLLAARAECLAQMSDDARRAFEQRVGLPMRPQCQKDGTPAMAECTERRQMAPGSVAPEIRNLIAEAHRLRKKAELKQDIKTALKGLDTAMRAVQLYGVVTGEIRDQRSANVTVNVVATRDEGIQTAAELLLELASAAELVVLISQLQERLAELERLQELPKSGSKYAEPQRPLLLAAPAAQGKEEKEDG